MNSQVKTILDFDALTSTQDCKGADADQNTKSKDGNGQLPEKVTIQLTTILVEASDSENQGGEQQHACDASDLDSDIDTDASSHDDESDEDSDYEEYSKLPTQSIVSSSVSDQAPVIKQVSLTIQTFKKLSLSEEDSSDEDSDQDC